MPWSTAARGRKTTISSPVTSPTPATIGASARPGQPFFAQIQLHGGKDRNAKVAHPTDPARVVLPPYYPDDPVIRQDWASYLDSWVKADADVGDVLDRLERDGLADSTVVFFFTDHGISHVRGKQFLYDEGIRVPLLVRFPDRRLGGTVRSDLVSLLDVAATSLDLAGIPIPATSRAGRCSRAGFEPRRRVYSARDRCDETPDLIRSVRTERYKYIRNFMSYASHTQPNRYKDGKEIMKRMRALHRKGKAERAAGQDLRTVAADRGALRPEGRPLRDPQPGRRSRSPEDSRRTPRGPLRVDDRQSRPGIDPRADPGGDGSPVRQQVRRPEIARECATW